MKNFYTIILTLIISMSAFAQSNNPVDIFNLDWNNEYQATENLSENLNLSYVLSNELPFNTNSAEYSLSKELLTTFVNLLNDKSNILINDVLFLEIEFELEQTSLSLTEIGITNPFDFISQIELGLSSENINSPKGSVTYQNKSGPGCLPEPTDNCVFIDLQDDGSTGLIPLPFTFELYGTNYNAVYINANGNITFNNPLAAFSAEGFPIITPMVAPFWGDFDFRICGTLCYEIFPDYLIVHYQFVCPYQTDYGLYNTMAVAIGTLADPVTGVGNNVVFDYRDMAWTTGDASLGVGGFGGIPATVGINAGDNINFVQIGRFDHAGVDYDGPGGNPDGVDYLDNQCISFNSTTSGNLPPSVVGLPPGGNINIDCDETATYTIQFSGPEIGQNITVTANTNGICGVSATTTDGPVGQVDLSIVGSACNVGPNTIVLTATDDGIPNETTTVTITLNVDPANCLGCTETPACNFDINATINDGSCQYPTGCDECVDGVVIDNLEVGEPCDDGIPETSNDTVQPNCECQGVTGGFPGCTDPTACNWNPEATIDDGSCFYCEIICPPDLTIEWPPDFNLEPVPPGIPQDPSVDPEETGQPTVSPDCIITSMNFQDILIGPGNCPAPWVLERIWTVTDNCGLTITCVQLITFTDLTPPDLICPPEITIEWGDPEGPPATGVPTVTDNCDPNPTLTYSDNVIVTGDCPIGIIIERAWTAVDICGNASTCLQVIFVQDTSPPTFTVPGNTTLEWPDDFNLDPVPPGTPQDPRVDPSCLSIEDQFGPADPDWFLDLPAGEDVMQSEGTIGVNAGDVLTCTLPGMEQITVSGPVLVTRGASADLALPTAPCPAVLNGLNDVIPTEIVEMELVGGGFTLRVGDGNGIGPGAPLPASEGHIVGQVPGDNTIACSYFEIWIEMEVSFPPFFLYNQEPLVVIDTIDRVPPQAIYVHLFPPGFCLGLYSSPTPGSGVLVASLVEALHKTVPIPVEDNCDLLPAVNYKDTLTGPFLGDCDTGLWVLERTWCAVDDCGNVSDPQIQYISFTDFTPPEIICPPDISINWGDPDDPSETGTPTVTDNCDPDPDLTFNDTETTTGNCPIVRIIERTWTATDLCGNSASCVQIISVIKDAPVNDLPSGALANTPDRLWGVPGWDTFDVGCATLSAQACGTGTPTSDSWYTFVAQAENQGILARANPADPNAANVDMAVEIFDSALVPLVGTTGGSCAVSRSCFNNVGAGVIERCVPGGLTIGDTYIYRVYDAAGGATGKSLLVDTKVKTYADHPILTNCVPLVTNPAHLWTIEDPDNLYNPVVPVFFVRMVVATLAGVPVAVTNSKNPNAVGGLNFTYSDFTSAIPDGMYNVHAQHMVKMHANGCVSSYWSQLGPPCPTTFSIAVPLPNSDNLDLVNQSLSPDLNFKAYPNPNQGDQVYLQLIAFPDVDQNVHVTITDMYGKLVHVEQFANTGNDIYKVVTFDNELSNGMYFINLTINNRIVSQKLIVE